MSRFTSAFKPAAASGFQCLGIALLLLAIGRPPVLSGQTATSRIRSVRILIDGRPGGDAIENLVSVEIGEIYSLNRIDNTIKQIYRTGLFSFIRAESTGIDQLDLVFHCTSRLFTRRIQILGSDELPRNRLRMSIVALGEEGPYSEEKQERAVTELSRALEAEGYFGARIRAYTERIPDSNRVDVFFQVQSPRRYSVGAIRFTGEVLLPESSLRSRMKTGPGRIFVPSELNADIDRLKRAYADAGYQRAEIRMAGRDMDDLSEKVDIALHVEPNEIIEIVIRGADVPRDFLQPIWENPIFEEWGAAEGEAKIVGYLRRRGYLYASVQSEIEREGNRIRIVHQVASGRKYRIGDLDFRGMREFTVRQLREALGLRESIPFLSNLNGARVFELPMEIEFLYKTRGFPETRASLNFEPRGATVHPIINIEEGRREVIESLVIDGNNLFPDEDLAEVMDSRGGGPYYQPDVQRDIEKLTNYYLDQGVRGTEINALIENPEENRFVVTFQVEEGRRVRIANIVVTGHKLTRWSTIRRELRIREGDLARWAAIRETKRRLENLGVFTGIQIEEIPLSPESENLLISLREGERHYVGLGLGLETREEPKTFEIWNNVIRPRGTAELIRGNMFGIAAQFSLVGQISLKERRGVFSWEQPYLFGLPVQTSLNGWLEREERTSYTFERQGVSLTAVRSLKEDQSLALVSTLRYARTKLITLFIEEDELDRQFFPYSTTSISGSVIWDKRGDPFNPESGHFFSSVLEWAYPLFYSESDFLKSFTKFQYYQSFWSRMLFSLTGRLGLGRGLIPIHERFFAGGSNSFRGARFDELGPKDPDSNMPVGGKALVLFNFELSFPVFSQLPNLFGTVFYDKGNVFARRKQVSLGGLQDALGLGLRYRTPLGPVRLELGWNLDAPQGTRRAFWFITIGNVF